jgi:hypothetical protein
MSDLYDADVLTWSEQQARLLRRHVAGTPAFAAEAGEPVNEGPDWADIIEEIESAGRSEVSAVESWWFQAFLHGLKAEAWPLARDVPHWRGEARGFLARARRNYRPSMQAKIDLAGLYADALSALPDTTDGQPPLPVPPACPVTLDALRGT